MAYYLIQMAEELRVFKIFTALHHLLSVKASDLIKKADFTKKSKLFDD